MTASNNDPITNGPINNGPIAEGPIAEGLILTVDLGTSSLRACLVDPALTIHHQVRQPVALMSGPDGRAEQNAAAIVAAALESIRGVCQWAEARGLVPRALCFSNAMASLVALDAGFNPLRPALTYADLRAHRQAAQLVQDYGRAFFHAAAAPMHASYWLPKFLWLASQGTDPSQIPHFCNIKDLLVQRLTGRLITDVSNAVSTGMCDARAGTWDPRLLDIAGLSAEQLPEVHPTTHRLPVLQEAGLPGGMQVVLGAMDGVLSSLGAGAFRPGQVTTAIGSSGACRVAAHSPLTGQEAALIWSYPLEPDLWFRGGAMNSGGLVTGWLVDLLFNEGRPKGCPGGEGAYEAMLAAAAEAGPGADGLICLPYLFGERTPIYDENARGVFFGLHGGHTRKHLARAGVEAILYAMYDMFRLVCPEESAGVEVRATGGYLRSELMLQIQADLFGLPVHIPAQFEGSTIGAAALALKALGRIKSYEALAPHLAARDTVLPNPAHTPVYRQAYGRFKALYRQLRPLFQPSRPAQ